MTEVWRRKPFVDTLSVFVITYMRPVAFVHVYQAGTLLATRAFEQKRMPLPSSSVIISNQPCFAEGEHNFTGLGLAYAGSHRGEFVGLLSVVANDADGDNLFGGFVSLFNFRWHPKRGGSLRAMMGRYGKVLGRN